MSTAPTKRRRDRLSVVGLFAGIGGIERGLEKAGHHTELLCEIEPGARAVLAMRFPDVACAGDIRQLSSLPRADVVAAGFPCQDLSQAGYKHGILGTQSGLVREIFRLIKRPGAAPRWLLLENVSYMLHLNRGGAMKLLTEVLDELGYFWAYRVVDARGFGVPQRRQRVILVASKTEDPRTVLFCDDAGPTPSLDVVGPVRPRLGYGFYWTEGKRGLGWAGDAIPTLKGGSRLGIPSPPAIWKPSTGFIGIPHLRDAERLQGFPVGWTIAAERIGLKRGYRWSLVGNAVCVPVAEWVGQRLARPGTYSAELESQITRDAWPPAAWGRKQLRREVNMSVRPLVQKHQHLLDFLDAPMTPLSIRAAEGFYSRARSGPLRFPDGFLHAVREHIRIQKRDATA